MRIISHRGNLKGREPELENHPDFIRKAHACGFEVEIDVWFENHKFILGHDTPQYEVNQAFLTELPLWCHAKNLWAAEEMRIKGIHYFWHDKDLMTLTSKGIPWCNLNVFVRDGITVKLERPYGETIRSIFSKIFGICTDYPLEWKKWLV
jgi:hypothetical protein